VSWLLDTSLRGGPSLFVSHQRRLIALLGTQAAGIRHMADQRCKSLYASLLPLRWTRQLTRPPGRLPWLPKTWGWCPQTCCPPGCCRQRGGWLVVQQQCAGAQRSSSSNAPAPRKAAARANTAPPASAVARAAGRAPAAHMPIRRIVPMASGSVPVRELLARYLRARAHAASGPGAAAAQSAPAHPAAASQAKQSQQQQQRQQQALALT
jgi:hypothetical protein